MTTRVSGRWRTRLHRLHRELTSDSSKTSWDDVREDSRRSLAAVEYLRIAVDAGLVADTIWLTELDSWPSDVREALERIRPGVDINDLDLLRALRLLHAESLEGSVNYVAGTGVFEDEVSELASQGKIALPEGADALEPARLGQEGFDGILTDHGETVGHVQIKFTDDVAGITKHLRNFPDVENVITTHDAAEIAATRGIEVIDSGVDYEPLREHVADALTDQWSASHALHQFLPVITYAVLGVAYLRLLREGVPAHIANEWIKKRAIVATGTTAVGTVIILVTNDPVLRIPTVLLSRWAVDRYDVAQGFAKRTSLIRDRLARYWSTTSPSVT